jgi:hypothetical protein
LSQSSHILRAKPTARDSATAMSPPSSSDVQTVYFAEPSPAITSHSAIHTPENTHPMLTRAKNNITKPKISSDGTTRYPLPHALLTVANLDFMNPHVIPLL